MLGKLLKYELRALTKQFAMVYPAAIAIAFITGFLQSSYKLGSQFNSVTAIVEFLFMGIMMAMGVLTIVFILNRFSAGLLKDEGYLMFTLPTKVSTLIMSKICIAMVTVVVSTIVALLSAFLFTIGTFGMSEVMSFIQMSINDMIKWTDVTALHIISFIIAGLSYTLSSILLIYLAISIGHLVPKHRTIVAILAWLIISTIFGQLLQLLGNVLTNWSVMQEIGMWLDTTDTGIAVHVVLLVGIAINLIWSTILFLGTNYILSNKLNLE